MNDVVVRVIDRGYQFRIETSKGVSNCHVLRSGDTCIMYGVIGRGATKAYPEIFSILKDRGVTKIYGDVAKAHVRLLRGLARKLGYRLTEDVPRPCADLGGAEMVWVTMEIAKSTLGV